MHDRKGVLLIVYDLPVETSDERRNAQRFRKNLISQGFISLQKSVYVKLIHNDSMAESEILQIKEISPKEGTINVIPMSLNVFRAMQTLCGEPFNQSLFSDDIVVL